MTLSILSACRPLRILFPALLALSGSAPALASGDYLLGAGDKVNLAVFGEPDLTRDILLTSTCTIEVGYIGTVNACGRTPKDVQSENSQRLTDHYILNPSVVLAVIEYGSQKVKLQG